MLIRRKFKTLQRVEVRFINEKYDHEKGQYFLVGEPEWLPGTFDRYDEYGNRKVRMDDGRQMGFNVLWKMRALDPGVLGYIFYYK